MLTDTMKKHLDAIADEAWKMGTNDLVYEIKLYLITKMLMKAPKIADAGRVLGLTRTTIHKLKSMGLIQDRERYVGNSLE